MPLHTVSVFVKLVYVHTVVIMICFIPANFFGVFVHGKGTTLTTTISSTPECVTFVVLMWATFNP